MRSKKNPVQPHFHTDEKGKIISCYHACKSVLASPAFWIGSTCSFPLEHFLWEKVWPFTLVSEFLRL